MESYALGNYNTWNSGFFDNRKSLLSPLGIIVFTFTALFRVTTNTIMLDPVMGSLVQHYCKQCTMYNMSLWFVHLSAAYYGIVIDIFLYIHTGTFVCKGLGIPDQITYFVGYLEWKEVNITSAENLKYFCQNKYKG